MNTTRILLGLAGTFGLALNLMAGDPPALDPRLEPLRPWLDKTWKQIQEPAADKADKPSLDVARWERALNGKSVRITHSISDGAYGGESIVRWDEGKQAIGYHYFTTADFVTEGTMTFKDGKITTREIVKGNAGGVTEVRATFEMRKDGTYHVKSEYLKAGVWTAGREATYREDTAAKVVFK